jgi:hypothetical protein
MSIVSDSENARTQPVHEKPLRTRMLEGASMIAFMSLFTMFGDLAPNDVSFGSRIILFILASLGGAVGGVAYYASDPWRVRGGIFKTLANVTSLLTYCAAAVLFIIFWALLGVGLH